jgi:hypothetical protein
MRMLTFLFWNLNRKPLHALVAELAEEHQADILVLVEVARVSDILLTLNGPGQSTFLEAPGRNDRVTILTRFAIDILQPVTDKAGIRICRLRLPARDDLLLVGAHLASALHTNTASHDGECARLAKAILEAETRVGHNRTVLVGDLNVDPFQWGAVSTHGLHAVMSRRIALTGERTVQGDSHLFFYNPMWSRFGDHANGPPGTYFYSGSHVSYFWHMFDQVMVRPALIECFSNDSLRILTRAGVRSLLSANGRPDKKISDHLPITFKLDV